MLTLWDLIEPVMKRLEGRKPEPAPAAPPSRAQADRRRSAGSMQRAQPTRPRRSARRSGGEGGGGGMQARYDAVVQKMLAEHGIRVRKWRTSMSGVAWTVTYTDGRVSRLIESPRPKGPMSAAVFLHEVGHHVIGLGRYRPRCLEEYHAWAWSLEQMEAHGLNVTEAVRRRMHASLYYAVAKARRRGIKGIPPELEPFMQRPARRGQAASVAT